MGRYENMQIKLLEIRDEGTFISAFAFQISREDGYLARRAGYGAPLIMLGRLHGGECMYDPCNWSGRTLPLAHEWIMHHWDEIKDHDVVDVQWILGETAAPKQSESETAGGIA
jgi:hypothetical protein